MFLATSGPKYHEKVGAQCRRRVEFSEIHDGEVIHSEVHGDLFKKGFKYRRSVLWYFWYPLPLQHWVDSLIEWWERNILILKIPRY